MKRCKHCHHYYIQTNFYDNSLCFKCQKMPVVKHVKSPPLKEHPQTSDNSSSSWFFPDGWNRDNPYDRSSAADWQEF